MASVRVRNQRNRMAALEKAAKAFDGRRIDVGVTGEHAYLARIHEFGCDVPVSDRMRAYLHGRGVHLRRGTTRIVIPERAFLRTGFDAQKGAAALRAAQIFSGMCAGKGGSLDNVGQMLRNGMQAVARAGVGPPRKAFPGSRGGPALTDTGAMIGSMEYEVK